jgi:hypothetical protein
VFLPRQAPQVVFRQDCDARRRARDLTAYRLGIDIEDPDVRRVVELASRHSESVRNDVVEKPDRERTNRILSVPRRRMRCLKDLDWFLVDTEGNILAEFIAKPDLQMTDSALQVTRIVVPTGTIRGIR